MATDLPEKNNLDLMRLALALVVCLVHAAQLPGLPALIALGELDPLASEIAVPAFFVISGLLIVRSFEGSSGFWPYLQRRARRILPAYLVAVIGAALALGPLSSAPAFYFTRDWWAYLGANLTFMNFLHPTLPGVFEGHARQAVNGVLWTIKIEVAFYLLVPLLVLARRRFGAAPVLGTVFLLSTAWSLALPGQLAHQLPGQLRFFMVGAAFFYAWPWISDRLVMVGGASALLLLLHQAGNIGPLYPLAVGGFIVPIALAPAVCNLGRIGDLSYGVYVLHFPLVQSLVDLGVFQTSAAGGVALSVALALIGAWLLWRFVEEPILRRREHHLPANAASRQRSYCSANS